MAGVMIGTGRSTRKSYSRVWRDAREVCKEMRLFFGCVAAGKGVR